MARTQNTIIGRASGSVGEVTFSTWKGVNVIKQKAVTVANPDTEPQKVRRAMINKGTKTFQRSPELLTAGFREVARNMSSFNAFMSANMATNSVNEGQSCPPYPNPLLLVVSKGSLLTTTAISLTADDGSTLAVIEWSPTTHFNQLASDRSYCILIAENGDFLGSVESETDRQAGGLNVGTNRPLVAGEIVYSFLFFTQTQLGRVSTQSRQLVTIT